MTTLRAYAQNALSPWSVSEATQRFLREIARTGDGNVEAVHQARVASRRIRELLPLLKLDAALTRKLSRRVRFVTRELGTVRELDVLNLLLQQFTTDGRPFPAALQHVAITVADARAVARDRLSARLHSAKLERLGRKLGRALDSLESDAPTAGRVGPKRVSSWALDARIARRAASVQAAIEAAGTVYAPERLHGVRIALKKLRYASELAAETRPSRRTADIKVLRSLQALLGQLHDLETLLVRVREAQGSRSTPNLALWRELGALAHAIEDDCRRLHGQYMHDRAGVMAIAERMGAVAPPTRLVGRATG
jgi:CHAD domain-containing protein